MSLKSPGYPVVSQSTLVAFMTRFLATEEGQMTAEQFAAAGVSAYFIQNPVEDDIASSVAAYLLANPPQNGQNATAQQVQQAVDAYYQANPDSVVTNAELASAVAAYLQANPPQQGAQGPAGQNATAQQVADAVAAYINANPLTSAINSAVAAYMAANPNAFKGAKGDNGTTFLTGSGAPLNTLGNVGDYYIDTVNDRLYGPKASTGTIWPQLVPLGARYVGTGNITQTAVIAISAGVRSVSVTVTPITGAPSIVSGDDVLIVPTTLPAGYMLQSASVATGTNVVTASLIAPLLAIGANYSIPARFYVLPRLT